MPRESVPYGRSNNEAMVAMGALGMAETTNNALVLYVDPHGMKPKSVQRATTARYGTAYYGQYDITTLVQNPSQIQPRAVR